MNSFDRFTSTTTRRCGFFIALALSLPIAHAQAIKSSPVVTAPTASQDPVLGRTTDGSVAITVSDLMSEIQRAPEATRQALLSQPDAVRQVVNNLMARRVLANEAKQDGLDRDPLVSSALQIAQDKILSDARLARLDAQNTPNEQALDAYAQTVYRANPSKFEQAAQTRASHILLTNTGAESLLKAQNILAELRGGASFEALAKANSTDAGSAARGGDLGFFSAGKMVPAFDAAVNALVKPGDLSEPVESQFGYHIIRLEERKPKGVQPYQEVRAQLLLEARKAILNEARQLKVQNMSKNFVFEQEAIEALAKPVTH